MTFSEYLEEVQDQLSAVGTSPFWSDTVLKNYINKSVTWLASQHKFPVLEKAQTTLATGSEYYDYPSTDDSWILKSDGISFLQVDGERWYKKRYNDLLLLKEDYPSATTNDFKYFSDFDRFIFPYPLIESGKTITIYGTVEPQEMTADTDTNVFSGIEPELEEAIIFKATSKALIKAGRYDESNQFLSMAIEISERIWKRLSEEQANYKSTQPIFTNNDYIGISGGINF